MKAASSNAWPEHVPGTPVTSKRSCMVEAEKGQFEELDAFLRHEQLDPLTLARLPAEPETLVKPLVEVVPALSDRQLKRNVRTETAAG